MNNPQTIFEPTYFTEIDINTKATILCSLFDTTPHNKIELINYCALYKYAKDNVLTLEDMREYIGDFIDEINPEDYEKFDKSYKDFDKKKFENALLKRAQSEWLAIYLNGRDRSSLNKLIEFYEAIESFDWMQFETDLSKVVKSKNIKIFPSFDEKTYEKIKAQGISKIDKQEKIEIFEKVYTNSAENHQALKAIRDLDLKSLISLSDSQVKKQLPIKLKKKKFDEKDQQMKKYYDFIIKYKDFLIKFKNIQDFSDYDGYDDRYTKFIN